ncbi:MULTISPECIES: MerR family transcriptional regulator [unclassified Streptomyces]|uniref:MerR family transcriptional regulator n=1 Tax=unclassified Streptomyces TaxID=2593676 RepID=UPI00380E25CA
MTTYRIAQVAERSGMTAGTLRFYEGAGLLAPGRTASGYRAYGEDVLGRLAFIGAAKRLGLTLAEIRELLAVWDGGVCREVRADLRPRLAARLADAERRAAGLAAFTDALRTAVARLDALPERDDACGPACGITAPPTAAADPAAVPATAPVPLPDEAWRTAPVACSLTGDGVRERAAAWHELVAGAARAGIDAGVRLTLPVERVGRVAELAAAEQRCCPFFDFRLRLDGPRLHLEVRAPAEGRGLLGELFGGGEGLTG